MKPIMKKDKKKHADPPEVTKFVDLMRKLHEASMGYNVHDVMEAAIAHAIVGAEQCIPPLSRAEFMHHVEHVYARMMAVRRPPGEN